MLNFISLISSLQSQMIEILAFEKITKTTN